MYILFLYKNDEPWFLISCLSYTSLECLTNWLPEVDCKNVLSITCYEKYTQIFNTLKCSIGKRIAEIYWLECFDEWKLSLLSWPCIHDHGELLFRVVVANPCSWPNVKRKTKWYNYNFIVAIFKHDNRQHMLTNYSRCKICHMAGNRQISANLLIW